jgi:Uma2 family endonuclease
MMATQIDIIESITSQDEPDHVILNLLPFQGKWSEEQYLWLTDNTNRLIEFTDGYLEVLPMPTDHRQAMLEYLLLAFRAFILPLGGKVRFAPLRMLVRPRTFREPDLLLLRSADDPRRQNRYWLGADLVVEIVSPDKPARDLVQKRSDYAETGISEYWIVNPESETITVLRLEGGTYTEHGMFGRGTSATSALLEGFGADVAAVFDAD